MCKPRQPDTEGRNKKRDQSSANEATNQTKVSDKEKAMGAKLFWF